MAKKRRQPAAPPAVIPPVPSQPVDQRPWAAYVLGHHSRAIRLWQTLFWQVNADRADTDQGVPLTVQELHQAQRTLTASIPTNVYQEIAQALDDLETLNEEMMGGWQTRQAFRSRSFGDGPAPGQRAWKQLILQADQALMDNPDLLPWFRLGVAVGGCRLQAFMEASTKQSTGFQDIASAALSIPIHQRVHIPVLVSLAAIASTHPLPEEVSQLRLFIERHAELCRYSDSDPGKHPYILDSLLISLDRQLQEDIQQLPAAATILKPRWDGEKRELWVGLFKVKTFTTRAKNVIPILSAFEEDGWPSRIDDPITGSLTDQPDRLKEAVASLNDGLNMLRFHVDGEHITWEWT